MTWDFTGSAGIRIPISKCLIFNPHINGSDYPRGLKGEEIPLAARLFAIVDVWDAITTDRPYRKGWPRKKALKYIREQSGKHFDPKMVEIFLQEIGE